MRCRIILLASRDIVVGWRDLLSKTRTPFCRILILRYSTMPLITFPLPRFPLHPAIENGSYDKSEYLRMEVRPRPLNLSPERLGFRMRSQIRLSRITTMAILRLSEDNEQSEE